MRITSTGYVGIGTTTPQNALNVVGDINLSRNIYTGFGGGFGESEAHILQFNQGGSYYSGYNFQVSGESSGMFLNAKGITMTEGALNITNSTHFSKLIRIGDTSYGTPTKAVILDSWVYTNASADSGGTVNCVWSGACNAPTDGLAPVFPSSSCGSPGNTYTDNYTVGYETEEVVYSLCGGITPQATCESTLHSVTARHYYCKGWRIDDLTSA